MIDEEIIDKLICESYNGDEGHCYPSFWQTLEIVVSILAYIICDSIEIQVFSSHKSKILILFYNFECVCIHLNFHGKWVNVDKF